MMALRNLLDALEEEGAAEHEVAQSERNRRTAEILTDARARAVDVCADGIAAAEASARQEAHSLLSQARTTAHLATRTARHAALDAVLDKVREQLRQLPGTRAGIAAAGACLEQALAALPQVKRVRVHPADVAALSAGVEQELIADLEDGGAVVEDDEGRYVDNTYATRLANTWAELRIGLNRSWEQPS